MPQTDLKKARANAKRIGVEIAPSKIKFKKLDVFKDGKKVASVGDKRYSDFLLHNDRKRQENYKARHTCRKNIGTPCYYADQLLWT